MRARPAMNQSRKYSTVTTMAYFRGCPNFGHAQRSPTGVWCGE
jgi:hypothetical protein